MTVYTNEEMLRLAKQTCALPPLINVLAKKQALKESETANTTPEKVAQSILSREQEE